MRKLLAVTMVMLLVAGTSGAQLTSGDAEARVQVRVNPTISVMPISVDLDLGTVSSGEFTGTVQYVVHTNMQYVELGIVATYLYKADDPGSPHMIPLTGEGVVIIALDDTDGVGANPVGGVNGEVPWIDPLNPISYDNGMLALATALQEFESGQAGRFSHDIDVAITWDQSYAELPEGDYSGFVKLLGVITP